MSNNNNNKTEEDCDLEKTAKAKGVRYLLPTISSFTGDQRGALVPVRVAKHLQKDGFGIYAIGQFYMKETDPEMYGVPDPKTLIPLPWKPEIGWLTCNVYHKGAPLKQCPRTRLIQLQREAQQKHGFVMKSGIEPELILLDMKKHEVAFNEVDLVDYHNPHITMDRSSFMTRVIDIMEDLGWEPYEAEKEAMSGQYEFSFNYADALTTADRHSFMKFMIKEIAKQEGFRATFMPAPFNEKYMGSGMHLNISLWSADGSKNLFKSDDPEKDELGVTQLAKHFMAGILKHAEALCAMVCPTVNSYKRLAASMSLPTVSYGKDTRMPMIRIPAPYNRLEFRIPDGSANPYLLQAAALAAGLDGINNKLELNPKEKLEGLETSLAGGAKGSLPEGMRTLPVTLKEAVDALEKDKVFAEVLGEELVSGFIKKKREQWESYCKTVTQWEVNSADDY